MDNGLIFPYPRRNAHAEPSDANRLKLLEPFGDDAVEHGTRTGSRQAMG